VHTIGILAAIGGLSLAVATTAVQAQEAFNWTGFYAGVLGGYGLDDGKGTGSSIGPASADLGGTVLSGSLSEEVGRSNGLFVGAVAGYNYQIDMMVLGAEAGLTVGGFGKTNSSGLNLSFTDGADTVSLSSANEAKYDVNWYTTLQGRMGLAFDNWLFFIKGGLAVADVSVDATSQLTVSDPGNVLIGDVNLPGASHANSIQIGPAFGFGAETMITDTISLSGEYGYVGLPGLTAPNDGLLGGLLGGGAPAPGTAGGTAFTGGFHSIKFGANFHF